MADILLQARSFSDTYSELNGTYRIPVSLRTYVRAALTIGFQSGVDARAADRSVRRYLFTSAHGLFGFLQDLKGNLSLKSAYHTIESSEKGTLTFRHAAILAKIVADRHLKIPWLANVDEMRRQGYLTTNEATKERGDYVGLDEAQNWHAIEAKGRSNGVADSLVEEAKKQASRIETVNGVAPAIHAACITGFAISRNTSLPLMAWIFELKPSVRAFVIGCWK
jgi:hypothetical protein